MSDFETTAIETTSAVITDVMRLDLKIRCEHPNPAGSLENWVATANTVFETPGLEHVALCILTGCAGVILQRCGYPTMGLHIYGPTSTGKTTGQVGAAAMWADPFENKGVLFTLRQTDNALEYPLLRGNGSSVHFDEGKSGAEALANLVWLAAGGTSKGRMRADGGMRKAHTWTTFWTATSEEPLQKYMHDAKKKVIGGVAARMVIIDITRQVGIDPVAARRIKEAFQNNYGHAGPAFVRAFIRLGYASDPQKLKDRIDELVKNLSVSGGSGVMLRANTMLAVLWASGEIMKAAGLLADDVDVERIIRWGADTAANSVEAEARDVGKGAARRVLEWFKLNPARVQDIDDKPRNSGLPGGPSTDVDDSKQFQPIVAYRGAHTGRYYIPTVTLERHPELDGTPEAVLKVWEHEGRLVKQSKNRTHAKIPGVGPVKHYRVEGKLAADAEQEDAETDGE